MGKLSPGPILRRTNRIRTIQSTLAIEQNTLSVEQVTAVLNGKFWAYRLKETPGTEKPVTE